MAKRYTKEEKQAAIDFVHAYDKKHGRGGKSAAAKEFGVNTNSIRNWMSGSETQKPKAKGRKPRKVAAQPKGVAQAAKVSNLPTLERMIEIENQISGLQAEFKILRSKLTA